MRPLATSTPWQRLTDRCLASPRGRWLESSDAETRQQRVQGELEGGQGELNGEGGRHDILFRQGSHRGHVHQPDPEGPARSGIDAVCIAQSQTVP